MRAAVYSGPAKHQSEHAKAMSAGLKRHGIACEMYRGNPNPKADFAVTWSWRNGKTFYDEGRQVLVMERGFLGDRFAWTSLGWNGLNGRATWPEAPNDPTRFEKNFGHLVKDWSDRKGYALIIGQVPGDMAIRMVNIEKWYDEAVKAMQARGYEVRYRPHPVALKRNQTALKMEPYLIGGTLEDALAGAAVVVSMNSNTGVDATLAGVPVIACDEGAMAWPVCAHGLDAELVRPDRSQWFSDTAWKQFTIPQIADGSAWELTRQALPMMADA